MTVFADEKTKNYLEIQQRENDWWIDFYEGGGKYKLTSAGPYDTEKDAIEMAGKLRPTYTQKLGIDEIVEDRNSYLEDVIDSMNQALEKTGKDVLPSQVYSLACKALPADFIMGIKSTLYLKDDPKTVEFLKSINLYYSSPLVSFDDGSLYYELKYCYEPFWTYCESLNEDYIDMIVPTEILPYLFYGDETALDYDKETYEPMFKRADEYAKMGDIEVLEGTECHDVMTDDFGFQNNAITIRIHKVKNESLSESIENKSIMNELSDELVDKVHNQRQNDVIELAKEVWEASMEYNQLITDLMTAIEKAQGNEELYQLRKERKEK